MAHQNMTTLCENYACTFHEAGGGSQNHIMLGGWDGTRERAATPSQAFGAFGASGRF